MLKISKFSIKCFIVSVLCSNFAIGQVVFATVTDIEPVPNQTAKFKIIRQINEEHFGIGVSGGLRKVLGIEKALEIKSPNSFAVKKGSSMWVVEGGITIVLSYEPKAGEPAPKEIRIDGIAKQTGINNLIAVLCCCNDTGGNCQLKNQNGVIMGCAGGDCCGQTVGLVDPGGYVKMMGNACKNDKPVPPPTIERH